MVSLNKPVPGVTQDYGIAPAGQDWASMLNSALDALNSGKPDAAAPAFAGNRMGAFDASLGLYRPASLGLQRSRAAAVSAVTGAKSMHTVVLGDSQSDGVDVTHAWPYVLRRKMQAALGFGGSGIRYPKIGWGSGWTWNNATSGTSFENPVNFGIYPHQFAGSTVVKINTDASIDIQAPAEGYDYVVLYYIAAGGALKVRRNGVADATNQWLVPGYPGQTPTAPGFTGLTAEPGYMKGSNPAAEGGQVVVKITPSSPAPSDVFRIMAGYNSTDSAYFAGIEFRKNDSAGGSRVSNLALSGRTLQELVGGFPNGNVNENTGSSGMAMGVDEPRGDLYLVALCGTNDWNASNSSDSLTLATYTGSATYKTRLTTLVQRIRATTNQGINGNSTPANADVVFVAFPEPDYAWYLANQGNHNSPTYVSYLQAMYQVADEQGVPVIDLAYRWPDHAKALALGVKKDQVHPSDVLGSADYGNAVYKALASLLSL